MRREGEQLPPKQLAQWDRGRLHWTSTLNYPQSAVSFHPASRHRYGSRQTRSLTSPTRAELGPHRDNAKQIGANQPKCSLIKPHSLLPPQRSSG